MQDATVLLSVIIPVYNLERFLPDCIESLAEQGVSDQMEVLCINDGSTDGSLRIILEYARKYHWIRCIDQPNAGVSAARNRGLEEAKGRYVVFVDGDDYLVSGALQGLLEEAVRLDADMLFFKHQTVPEQAGYVPTQPEQLRFVVNPTDTAISTLNVWGIVFRRGLIEDNRLRFAVGMKYAEDVLFSFFASVFAAAQRQAMCTNKLYCYRQRAGSAMHARRTAAMHMQNLQRMQQEYQKFLKDHRQISDYWKHTIRARLFFNAATVLFDALKSKEVDAYAVRRQLEQEGLYPYPALASLLKGKKSLGNYIKYYLRHKAVFAFFAKTRVLELLEKQVSD